MNTMNTMNTQENHHSSDSNTFVCTKCEYTQKEMLHFKNKYNLIISEVEYLKQIIQSCLDFGRIYHHQKKTLKKLGFKTLNEEWR